MTSRLQTLAASSGGRIFLAILCCAALWPAYGYVALLIFGAIAVAATRPDRRPEVFSLLAILIFLSQVIPQSAAGGLGYKPLLFSAGWIAAVVAWSRIERLRRIGLLPLHLFVAIALAALAVLNTGGIRPVVSAMAWQQLAMALLWRTSYWMKWRAKSGREAPIVSRLFALIPCFGSGGVPIGKSPEYFERYEARKPQALAEAHVEGAKLLLLALIYRLILIGLDRTLWNPTPDTTFFDLQALIPPMNELMADPAQFAVYARWIGLCGELIRAILELAVFGHTAVGICCWMGYKIPRNTRSPLWSNSIFDFWTRYYFYFKELLLDFFFFPVYLKLKRFSPVTRTVLATFAAACAGNFYYHALLYASPLMQLPGNLDGYLQWIGARAIYCVVLATGLSFSMIRTVKNPQLQRRRWLGIMVSAAFFALLHIWSYGAEPFTIAARWRVFASLFGIG